MVEATERLSFNRDSHVLSFCLGDKAKNTDMNVRVN